MYNLSKQKIDSEQLYILQHLLRYLKIDIKRFHKYFNVRHLHELDVEAYAKAINLLNIKFKIDKNKTAKVEPNYLFVSNLAEQRKMSKVKINLHLDNIGKTVLKNQIKKSGG